jgi:hypothetical protein
MGVARPGPQIDERQLQGLWLLETRNQHLRIAEIAHFCVILHSVKDLPGAMLSLEVRGNLGAKIAGYLSHVSTPISICAQVSITLWLHSTRHIGFKMIRC